MRRMLFRDEASHVFFRAQPMESQRPPMTQAQADQWHKTQGERAAREKARSNWYLTHDTGSSLYPGDEEREQL